MLRVAFERMNLHRVWLEVFADHPRAVHVYEKAGFRREGLMRQAEWRDSWHDIAVMGVLHDEWARRRRATAARRPA